MLKRSDCPCEWRWKRERSSRDICTWEKKGSRTVKMIVDPGSRIENKNRGPVVRVVMERRIGGMIEQRLMGSKKHRWWMMTPIVQEYLGESFRLYFALNMTYHNAYMSRVSPQME